MSTSAARRSRTISCDLGSQQIVVLDFFWCVFFLPFIPAATLLGLRCVFNHCPFYSQFPDRPSVTSAPEINIKTATLGRRRMICLVSFCCCHWNSGSTFKWSFRYKTEISRWQVYTVRFTNTWTFSTIWFSCFLFKISFFFHKTKKKRRKKDYRVLPKKSIANLFALQTGRLVWSHWKALIIISSLTWKFKLDNSLSLDT